MGKATKALLLILVISVLAFIGVVIGYQYFKDEPVDSTSIGTIVQNDKDKNNIEHNIDRNEIEKEDINKDEENIEINKNTNEQTQQNEEEKIDQNIDENKITPPVEKAIQLAKDKWIETMGNTNSVTFGNVTIQGDGKYVVCVSDNRTTISVCFYIVDLNTGIVEER